MKDFPTWQLATFYKRVATAIYKSPTKAISLAEIEAMNSKNADACYGWMQWPDAKRWFAHAGAHLSGCHYTIQRQHAGKSMLEIHKEINQHYKLFKHEE